MKLLRWITTVTFFVLVAAFSVHSLDSINQDIGRHLKTGQVIWETKSIPHTNLFSFTEPDAPFVNHHWLSEVVFYLLNGLIGLKGLIIFKAAIILAAFFLILKSLPAEARNWPFLTAGLFGILVFSSRTDVRPEIFSYLFLAFFLFAILKAKYGQSYKWLYALPIIQLVWTNMHIYFVLGPVLLFFFLVDRLAAKENSAFLKKLFLIFVTTSAATLLNPNFLRGALEPLNILKHYGYSIIENQSIFFLKDYGIQLKDINFFEISLVVLIISFIVAIKNGKRKIIFEALAVLFFTILAGQMIRNFGIYALAFVPLVTLNLAAYAPKRPVLTGNKGALFLCSIFIFLTAMLGLSVVNNRFYGWTARSQRFGLAIPAGAGKGVEFVKENEIAGPVFNNFDVGSFLIWKLYPEQKVFVDGRPEAYSVDFFEKIYKPMQEDPQLWKKYSDLYKINYVFFDYKDITPWAQKFLSDISLNPGWPLIYADDSTVIFIRKTAGNRSLIEKFGKK